MENVLVESAVLLNKYASNTTMALLHQVIDKSGEDRFIERQASSGLESSVVQHIPVTRK